MSDPQSKELYKNSIADFFKELNQTSFGQVVLGVVKKNLSMGKSIAFGMLGDDSKAGAIAGSLTGDYEKSHHGFTGLDENDAAGEAHKDVFNFLKNKFAEAKNQKIMKDLLEDDPEKSKKIAQMLGLKDNATSDEIVKKLGDFLGDCDKCSDKTEAYKKMYSTFVGKGTKIGFNHTNVINNNLASVDVKELIGDGLAAVGLGKADHKNIPLKNINKEVFELS